MSEKGTTIRIKISTREALKTLKVIPEEPYNRLILRLIGNWKKSHRYENQPRMPVKVNQEIRKLGYDHLKVIPEDDDPDEDY